MTVSGGRFAEFANGNGRHGQRSLQRSRRGCAAVSRHADAWGRAGTGLHRAAGTCRCRALEQRAQAAVQTANQGGVGQRVTALTRVLANPHLPDSQRQVGLTFLRDAIDQAKVPDGVKEFLWARGNGMTQARNPTEYAREKQGPTPADSVEQRRAAADAAGLVPGSPGYQSYLLTGKMPREDQQPLSATDKKAVMEADEAIPASTNAIGALKEAKALSKKAYEGPTAGGRGYVLSLWKRGRRGYHRPDERRDDERACPQPHFGAAPTEGERKILLDIQGSVSQPES